MSKTVFLISGLKRSGKDYVSSRIEEHLANRNQTFCRFAFADALKDMITKVFGISLEELDMFKNDVETYKLEILSNSDSKSAKMKELTFRNILQNLGEAVREILGSTAWANIVKNQVQNSTSDYIIISDFRLLLEYGTMLDYCLTNNHKLVTIKVYNASCPKIDKHNTENDLDDFTFDCVIDNTGYPNNLDLSVILEKIV